MSTKALNVLLVEDTEDIRSLLTEALHLYEHNVFTAVNGLEALNLIEEIPPVDIILLDLMMPVMDGWTFLERKNHNHLIEEVPVIIMSGAANNLPKGPRIKLLPKPINLAELFRTLQTTPQRSLEGL